VKKVEEEQRKLTMKEKPRRTKLRFGLSAENIMKKNRTIRKQQKMSAGDHGKI